MKRSLMAVWIALAAALPASATSTSKRYIIGFKPGVVEALRLDAFRTLGLTLIEKLDELDAMVGELPFGTNDFSTLESQALSIPSIFVIEEDFHQNWLVGERVSFQGTALPAWGDVRASVPSFIYAGRPDDGLPPGVDAAELPWGIRRVDAAAAWATTQGEGVKVAVVDTGIDSDHPDLKGRVAGGYCALSGCKSWKDENSHGTHVSGTIAGALDGKGVAGVAPKASLYAVRVLDKNGGGSLISVIKGLIWCGKNNMQVANMSLGSSRGSFFMHWAVKYATKRGVVIIAAAGNSGSSVGYPASYSETIAVAASDDKDQIAKFSSRGPQVDFIAPGVKVKSSIPGGGYAEYSGTSMATPHVTGLAALAVSRGAAGLERVHAALKKASKSIGLKPEQEGAGLIDAALLVK